MALSSSSYIASTSLQSRQKDIRPLRTAASPPPHLLPTNLCNFRRRWHSPSVQANHTSTHSNFGKDANMMMCLKRRIEDLRRQEVMVGQEEEERPLHEYGTMGSLIGVEIADANMMMCLRRRIEELRRQEVMVWKEEKERSLHEYGTMGSLDNNWLQWERDYKEFYQEEVFCMMARLQEFLLRCRPSLSIILLICICVCLPIGAFHTLSTLFSCFLSPFLLLLAYYH